CSRSPSCGNSGAPSRTEGGDRGGVSGADVEIRDRPARHLVRRVAEPGEARGLPGRAGDVEAPERHREALTARLHVRLLARPAEEEGVLSRGLGELAERLDLARGEEELGDLERLDVVAVRL